MAKQKKPRYRTPKLVLKFPWLSRADTQYDANGVWHTKALLDPSNPEHKQLMDFLKKASVDAYNKLKAEVKNPKAKKELQQGMPYTEEFDESGEETGMFLLSAKQNCKIKLKGNDGEVSFVDAKIHYFDAAGKPIKGKLPAIYAGTVARISYELSEYIAGGTAGVNLRIKAIQICELVSGGGGSAEDYGFEAEDGYTADDGDFDGSDSDSQSDSGAEGQDDF